MSTEHIKAGDVIRARRYGNKTVANYVIDTIADTQFEGTFSVHAHREYSGSSAQYMTFDPSSVRVLRSYA